MDPKPPSAEAAPSSEQIPEPAPITVRAREIAPVIQLQQHLIGILNQLRPGDPIRGSLAEALLQFQLNARPEFKP